MLDFFKKMGQGVLTILALPLIVIVLAVGFVWALLTYLLMLLKAIFIFFRGGRIFEPTERDRKAAEELARQGRNDQAGGPNQNAQQPLYVNNATFYGAQLPPNTQFNGVNIPQNYNGAYPPGYSGQINNGYPQNNGQSGYIDQTGMYPGISQNNASNRPMNVIENQADEDKNRK